MVQNDQPSVVHFAIAAGAASAEAAEHEPIFADDLGAIIPAGPVTHLLFT
jgi:hypothetical protein